jgi:hypothetical protein
MRDDSKCLVARGAARRSREALFRLLENVFEPSAEGRALSFEELRARHVKALGILGKYFRMTGNRKNISNQFYALSVMLYDLHRGIVHPALMPKKPRGRADDRSDVWTARIIAACGVECLIRSGLSRRAAGAKAAKEFPKLKTLLRTNTTLKTALVSWRDALVNGPLNDIVARAAAEEFRCFVSRWGNQMTPEQFGVQAKAYLKSASVRAAALVCQSPSEALHL